MTLINNIIKLVFVFPFKLLNLKNQKIIIEERAETKHLVENRHKL